MKNETEEHIRKIYLNLLRKNREKVAEQISSIIKSRIFEQRHTLHPRDIKKIANEYVDSLAEFLERKDKSLPVKIGETAAIHGLTILTVLEIFHSTDIFIAESMADLASEKSSSQTTSTGKDFTGKDSATKVSYVRNVRIDKTKEIDGDKNIAKLQLYTGVAGQLELLSVFEESVAEEFQRATERMILEQQEQLRKALSTAILQQKKQLLIMNHAIETSLHGILLTDLQGKITYMNPALKDLLKKSGVIVAMEEGRSSFNLGDEKEIYPLPIELIIGRGKAEELLHRLDMNNAWQGEISLTGKNGENINVFVSASIITDDKKKKLGAMFSFVDITERKKLEAQVRQSQKMEALGQLAGGISHDFNNILAAISGYAELQLLDFPETSQQYKDTMQIKLAAERGKELTKQLLFFTRRSSLEKKPINLNNLVKETVMLLKRTFPPEIEITTELAKDLKETEGNTNQINQVLMNLCVNARDAIINAAGKPGIDPTDSTGSGQRIVNRGMIKITTYNADFDFLNTPLFPNAKPGNYVCLKVQDTGKGMSQEIIEHIFEPFFTTKREEKGTGLGLSVAYGIVQNHGGFINVRSSIGVGSSFEVYLPVLEENSKITLEKKLEEEIYPGNGTVLLVEDEPQVRNMEIRTLEKSGYRVFVAKNGREAVELFKDNKNEIDLVILDMIMPEMGGKECFYHLRKIDPNVKILIITGYIEDITSSDMIKQGRIEILEKPFKLFEFTKKIYTTINS